MPAVRAAMTTDPRTSGSIRHTLWLYLGAFLALFAVALLFGARAYGQRAANRSYDHLLVSSALSIIDSVALVEAQWQVDLPYAALDLLAMAPEDRVFYRVADSRGTLITGYGDLPSAPRSAKPSGDAPTLFDAPALPAAPVTPPAPAAPAAARLSGREAISSPFKASFPMARARRARRATRFGSENPSPEVTEAHQSKTDHRSCCRIARLIGSLTSALPLLARNSSRASPPTGGRRIGRSERPATQARERSTFNA